MVWFDQLTKQIEFLLWLTADDLWRGIGEWIAFALVPQLAQTWLVGAFVGSHRISAIRARWHGRKNLALPASSSTCWRWRVSLELAAGFAASGLAESAALIKLLLAGRPEKIFFAIDALQRAIGKLLVHLRFFLLFCRGARARTFVSL